MNDTCPCKGAGGVMIPQTHDKVQPVPRSHVIGAHPRCKLRMFWGVEAG